MVRRMPDTAVIAWKGASTKASNGRITEGANSSLSISCFIDPKSGNYASGKSEDTIPFSFLVLADRFTGDSTIPEGANITFNSQTRKIVHTSIFQKHVEFKC